MSGDLFSLLTGGSKKPRPPRPPARTNPRPSAPTGVVRGGGDLYNLMTPGSKNAPIAPPAKHPNTVSHNPNTGYAGTRKLSVPIQGDYRISTPYGPRIHPITGRASNHTGMDLAVGAGTPIYAPRSGVIEQTNANDSVYGNQVIMRNGPSLETMYGHMAEYAVEPGQRLKRGDLIGYVGSTGLSTGPHLHWETWKNGNPVNPANLYDPSLPRRIPKALQVPKPKPNELPDMSGEPDSDLGHLLATLATQQRQATPQGPPQGASGRDPQLRAFLRGISDQESGGNYNAVGVDTGGGHRAYGKYQIMDFNIEGPDGWDQEALGRNIDIQQFLNDPKIQEKIARAKLASYFKQYGPSGAAKAWYAGPGNANTNSNAPQYGGPSINSYADSVLNHMQNYL